MQALFWQTINELRMPGPIAKVVLMIYSKQGCCERGDHGFVFSINSVMMLSVLLHILLG